MPFGDLFIYTAIRSLELSSKRHTLATHYQKVHGKMELNSHCLVFGRGMPTESMIGCPPLKPNRFLGACKPRLNFPFSSWVGASFAPCGSRGSQKGTAAVKWNQSKCRSFCP